MFTIFFFFFMLTIRYKDQPHFPFSVLQRHAILNRNKQKTFLPLRFVCIWILRLSRIHKLRKCNKCPSIFVYVLCWLRNHSGSVPIYNRLCICICTQFYRYIVSDRQRKGEYGKSVFFCSAIVIATVACGKHIHGVIRPRFWQPMPFN